MTGIGYQYLRLYRRIPIGSDGFSKLVVPLVLVSLNCESRQLTSRMLPGHTPRAVIPAFLLVGLVGLGLGVGYYFAVAEPAKARVDWSLNPLHITFSEQQ